MRIPTITGFVRFKLDRGSPAVSTVCVPVIALRLNVEKDMNGIVARMFKVCWGQAKQT